MRTKALLGLAVLAVSAATCVAQNVYSLNIVGYVNKTVEANKWYLLENPLTQTDNTVANIIKLDTSVGSPWSETVLFTYTPAGGLVAAETFYEEVGWYPGTTVLTPGQGFYLYPKTSGTITFVGEVQLSSTQNLVAGFNMVGSAYPAAMSLTELGLTGQNEDVVLRLTPAGFNPITYYADGYDGWYDAATADGGPKAGPALDVGEAVWYFNNNATFEWTQNFTVGN